MANEGGSGEPMPHVRGLDGARLAQAAAAMTQAGGANLTAGARKWSSEALAGKVPDTATYESERPWMDEALHPVDRFELLWDAAGRCNVVVSVHEIATVRLARDRWETARSFSFGLDPFRAVQGRHEGGGSSSAEGSPSPGPDPGEGAAGVVLADELDLDEVALALAGGIPESGGKVGVVEGYKDALRPAEDEVFTGGSVPLVDDDYSLHKYVLYSQHRGGRAPTTDRSRGTSARTTRGTQSDPARRSESGRSASHLSGAS